MTTGSNVRARRIGMRAGIALIVTMFGAGAAPAAPLLFEVLGFRGNVIQSFMFDDHPTAQYADPGGSLFVRPDDGSSNGIYGVTFTNAQYGGGLYLAPDNINYRGDQIYSGDETSPVFSPNTFNIYGPGANALRVTAIQSAPTGPGAPGPLVGLGVLPALAAFAGLGATRLRRRRSAR